jgi:hypothetical protein
MIQLPVLEDGKQFIVDGSLFIAKEATMNYEP